jgi:hypothetical protein
MDAAGKHHVVTDLDYPLAPRLQINAGIEE